LELRPVLKPMSKMVFGSTNGKASLSKRFPFGIYYTVDCDSVTIVAILDLRREPLWIREHLDDRK
jgi:hypothetical protein